MWRSNVDFSCFFLQIKLCWNIAIPMHLHSVCDCFCANTKERTLYRLQNLEYWLPGPLQKCSLFQYFKDQNNESQSSSVTCPKFHYCVTTELSLRSNLPDSRASAYNVCIIIPYYLIRLLLPSNSLQWSQLFIFSKIFVIKFYFHFFISQVSSQHNWYLQTWTTFSYLPHKVCHYLVANTCLTLMWLHGL